MTDDDREDPEAVYAAGAMERMNHALRVLVDSFLQASEPLQQLAASEQERKRQQRYESRRNRAPHPKVLR